MIVVWLFYAVPWVGLQSVVVVFPDHAHLLFGPYIPCRVGFQPMTSDPRGLVYFHNVYVLYPFNNNVPRLHARGGGGGWGLRAKLVHLENVVFLCERFHIKIESGKHLYLCTVEALLKSCDVQQ